MGAYQFGKAGRPNISNLLRARAIRVFGCSIAALFVLSFLIGVYIPDAKADITTTRSFLSTSADAQLSYYDSTWATTWEAYESTWVDSGGTLVIGGVEYTGSVWNIARSCVFFDSSDLPEDANITSAIVSLWIDSDSSVTDFNLTVQGTGTYPHNPAVASDYYRAWYGTTSLGSRSTGDGLSASAYWNISLNAAGIALINDGGVTRFILRSQEDIDGSAPTTNEFIMIGARDKGENYAPKLYVTYTVAGGGVFNYYFYGPYSDDGRVVNGRVNCTLYPTANETLAFQLVGDGVTPDYFAVSLEQQAVLVKWNITEGANYTRIIHMTDVTTETFYIAIPNGDLPFSLYTFIVNDFVGVANGYLESRAWIAGQTRVIERQPMFSVNAVPFYMGWSQPYDMRVVCDEGTLERGPFTALAVTENTVIIPYESFPHVSETLSVVPVVSRLNGTAIAASYVDAEDKTAWLYIEIEHLNPLTGVWTTSYSSNTTSANSYSLTWGEAFNNTDYLVQIQVYRDGGTLTWSFNCPYPRGTPNIWAPLANLGNFAGTELTLEYVPAIVLVVASLLAFSFWHVSAGCWTAWAVACLCTFMGWLPYYPTTTPVMLGVAAFICAGITIGEFKRGEREM